MKGREKIVGSGDVDVGVGVRVNSWITIFINLKESMVM